MRIKNKYLRNRSFRIKHWNYIRSKSQPYKTIMPWFGYNTESSYSADEQIKNHFEWITQQSRAIENGCHTGMFHSTSSFRRLINKERKAKERAVMQKIRNGNIDVEFPKFRRDADWYYF